jgi:hypothetical protein
MKVGPKRPLPSQRKQLEPQCRFSLLRPTFNRLENTVSLHFLASPRRGTHHLGSSKPARSDPASRGAWQGRVLSGPGLGGDPLSSFRTRE